MGPGDMFPTVFGIFVAIFILVVIIIIVGLVRSFSLRRSIEPALVEATSFPTQPVPGMALVKCQYCGHEQAWSEKCSQCGAPLPKPSTPEFSSLLRTEASSYGRAG